MKRLLIFLIVLLATGCTITKSKLYNSQYGYADNNPTAYSLDLNYCTQESYKRFPQQPYPRLREVPQAPQGGGMSVGMAMRQGQIMADVDRYNRSVIQQYEYYNQQRENTVDLCLINKGWRSVKVEEDLF